ncbi:MAG: HSP20 family protein [Candidatus Nanohaloarchaea archaeon]|jgi:HSP20 family protein
MRRLNRRDGLDDIFEQMQRFAEGVQEKGMSLAESGIPVDIQEDDEEIKITADLPGVQKEDINLKADEDGISITAEHEAEIEEENEKYVRRERSRKTYQRTVRWPAEVNPESITANYENGVLKITAEKVESEGHNIDIE